VIYINTVPHQYQILPGSLLSSLMAQPIGDEMDT
jgi:hypothetical protein